MKKGSAVLVSLVLHVLVVGAFVLLTKGGERATPKPPVAFVAQLIFPDEEPIHDRPVPPSPRAPESRPAPVTEAPVQQVASSVAPVAEAAPLPAVEERPSVSAPSAVPEAPAAPAQETASKPASSVIPASVVSLQKPKYPARLRTLGVEGVVRLEVTVSSDGRCLRAVVVQSSGYADMDSRALEAVRKATFQPQTVDTTPGVGTMTLTIRYSLE